MLRDQSEQSNDSYMIEEMDLSIINQDTLVKYRTAYNQYHKEDHPFVKDDNENFLIHIGAAKRDKNDVVHPTKAGLLMFGNFYDITNVYPNYFLDYQDHRNLEGDDMRWSFRITSTNGDWSGNLYDFYYRIIFKLIEDIAVPFKMNGMFRDDSSLMKKAIREALCNTLSNADYHGELGLVIKQYHDKLVFSNPGVLAIPLNKILLGGTSKARNRTILNIFSYVNIGERAGSGYPLILNATKEGGYPTPELYDEFNPDGTKLIIFIKKIILQDERPDVETERPDVETERPDVEAERPDVGAERPDVGAERPDIGVERPDIGVEKTDVETEKPDVEAEKPDVEAERPDVETERPDIGVEKPDVETEKPDIPSLINIIDCSNNIKTNLLIIYKKLGNTIYSRSDVIKVTFSGKSQASLYIKLLKDNGLIEPVIGYGKGKYKFK